MRLIDLRARFAPGSFAPRGLAVRLSRYAFDLSVCVCQLALERTHPTQRTARAPWPPWAPRARRGPHRRSTTASAPRTTLPTRPGLRPASSRCPCGRAKTRSRKRRRPSSRCPAAPAASAAAGSTRDRRSRASRLSCRPRRSARAAANFLCHRRPSRRRAVPKRSAGSACRTSPAGSIRSTAAQVRRSGQILLCGAGAAAVPRSVHRTSS